MKGRFVWSGVQITRVYLVTEWGVLEKGEDQGRGKLGEDVIDLRELVAKSPSEAYAPGIIRNAKERARGDGTCIALSEKNEKSSSSTSVIAPVLDLFIFS